MRGEVRKRLHASIAKYKEAADCGHRSVFIYLFFGEGDLVWVFIIGMYRKLKQKKMIPIR